ncbi:MAG: hypothetical protein DMG39_21510 [Acidobacteria bacterium]|nr:MAG: hypothetical protein DMG39_21510 [Acidobacteriota bacterium]
MHPLQTFSGVGVPPLEGKVFAVEGDVTAVRAARQIARALRRIPSAYHGRKKILYHAAAALAAWHVLALVEAATHATQLLVSLAMKRREAARTLLPLTRQVLDNFERVGPRAAWTGPLARGDYKIVEAHQRALHDAQEEIAQA